MGTYFAGENCPRNRPQLAGTAEIVPAVELEHAQARLRLKVLAKQIRSSRQMRLAHFPAKAFGEPAWEILLSLYVGNGPFLPKSLAREAGISTEAAERWIRFLENEGLVTRLPGLAPVQLSAKAERSLESYLSNQLSQIEFGHHAVSQSAAPRKSGVLSAILLAATALLSVAATYIFAEVQT